MAWNPSPKVADARELARKWRKRQVVILMLDDNYLEAVSFGDTRKLCEEARVLADEAYEAVMNKLKARR